MNNQLAKYGRTACLASCVLTAALSSAWAANLGNASAVNLKIYEVRLSPTNDCLNGVTIFRDDNPSYQNMLNGPTFGSGAVPNGTYHCFMVKMSDQITGTSAYNSDGMFCTVGSAIALDVARPGSGDATPTDPDGNTITVQNGEDIVWAYFKTSPSGDEECLVRSNGCLLGSPIIVSSDRSITFVTDFTGKVEDTGFECDIQPPVMSAR